MKSLYLKEGETEEFSAQPKKEWLFFKFLFIFF